MPGRFFLTEAIDGVVDPPRFNIAPGQDVIVLTSDGPHHMRWGIIPVGRVNARGRPVMETIINARSETVFDKSAFEDVKRAIVPAGGWYEWTGEKRKKQPWRITRKDGGLLYFAAVFDVWHGPGGIKLPQVATITCAPSADVRDIHHRMGVIVEQSQCAQWIEGAEDTAKSLMEPLADGMLCVEKADDVDWDGP